MALEPNQVKLSDGRLVTMRETNGRDEIAASQMLGKHFTQDAAGLQLYQKALVMRGIESVDGKPPVTGPIKFKDYMDFWGSLKTRDTARIMKKYQEMNGDDDGPFTDDSSSESDDLQTTLLSGNQ